MEGRQLPLAIISNRYRLGYVAVPKCGTTTMLSVIGRLHDLPAAERGRRSLKNVPRIMDRIDRDTPLVAIGHRQIPEARASLDDYTWFSVVRDPYSRLLSNYHNKLNRFCWRFRKGLYLRYKLLQAVSGPRAWRDARPLMSFLGARVTYREFVRVLCENGINWDVHFIKQTDLLVLDRISYTRLLRLEDLAAELESFLKEAGLPADRLAGLSGIRRNRSSGETMYGTRAETAERSHVYRLYQDDFDRLGYNAGIQEKAPQGASTLPGAIQGA